MQLSHPFVRAIQIYIEWYRQEYQIVVGSIHVGGDDMSATAEMLELLARAEVGAWPWDQLDQSHVRLELYSYVVRRVEHLRSRGVVVTGWSELPAWQTSTDMVELLRYIWAFRFYHDADPSRPRDFRYDDLGEMGELLLGGLVNKREFEDEWDRLSDEHFLAQAVRFAREVCWPRLEAYRIRKGLGPLPCLEISMAM